MRYESGQSIIQVMIGAGLMGIMSVAFMSMQTAQARQNKMLSEQMARMDFHGLVRNAIINGDACSSVLSSAGRSFNAAAVEAGTPSPVTPAITQIPASNQVGAPVVAGIGAEVSPMASSLVISSIEFLVTQGSGTTFMGEFRIGFNNAKLVRPLQPVVVQTLLEVDTTIPATAKVTACGAEPVNVHGSKVFNFTGADQTWTVPAGVTKVTVKAWGGGGGSPGAGAPVVRSGNGRGGGAAYSTKEVAVVAGQVLTIKVGGGGGVGAAVNIPGPGGWPNGAAGGISGMHPGTGGGGGGSSSVLRAGTALVEAGGGAGSWWCSEAGNLGRGVYGGGAGRAIAGACAPSGVQPGQSPAWGGCGSQGGGGGGYCGGGSVLGNGFNEGGTSFGTSTGGADSTAGNASDSPCNSTCGKGGELNSAGNPGVVHLSW